MKVLAVLLLASRIMLVSGGLVVLRGKELIWRYTHSSRKLMCVSEDDGSGLTWNSNLNWLYSAYEFSDRGGDTAFQSLNPHQRREIDCDLNSHDSCMSAWKTASWNLTNSAETPMGPVYDRRWEDFREYNNFKSLNEYRLIDRLKRSGAFVVSIRGTTDAHVLLCDTEYYEYSFCYWIIIGGWTNTRSAIRKCANGVPPPMHYPIYPNCNQIRASHNSEVLSPTEWRTFVLIWNENPQTIAVYDSEKLLMAYEDNDKRLRNETSDYNLFLRSTMTMLLRFHIYSFLRTSDLEATLTSPVLNTDTVNLCIEMVVGLCAECEIEVALVDPRDENSGQSLGIIERSTVAAAHGLPTWQRVRINKTVSSDFEKTARIKLIPRLGQRSLDPLWAVANVRVCPPVGTMRYGVMEATQDYDYDKYVWPNVTCQKLSRNESIVVDSTPDATTNSEFDEVDCPEGKVGPYCSVSCYKDLENVNCRGTVICSARGCTCPAGFFGKDCRTNCDIGLYGYDCKGTCGSCYVDNCSFITGHCKSGCDNVNRYYIPPFCKTAIDVLPPPIIDFINETTVRAVLPVREEYRLLPSAYQFVVWKEGEITSNRVGSHAKIFGNVSTMVGYTDHLEPGISYRISFLLYVDDDLATIRGEWKNFTTRCSITTDFRIEMQNTSLTLKMGQGAEDLYSCPSGWYDFLFESQETGMQISKGKLAKLPYEFTALTPFTLYKITISKGAAILFSREVRTLDGEPSRVRNLKAVLVSNEEVAVKWDPPLYTNGIILKYEVALKVRTYFGCKNLKVQPPKRDATFVSTTLNNINFPNLAPYAHYDVKVVPYTSYRGPEKQTDFVTSQAEIPSEVYSDLKFENYTLSWDAPKDCTTISGPILAKIVVAGLSKAVANFSTVKQTMKYSINLNHVLHGVETYEARVYVIRNYNKMHNEFRYEKLVFTTPPKAPPPVSNLDIYEIDSMSTNVYLRWLKPEPPLNGELRHYVVSSCHPSCKVVLRVRPTEYCELWDRYICATVTDVRQSGNLITVSAMNVNVSKPSRELSVPVASNPIEPQAPEIFVAEVLESGIVNLTWSHPWKTGGHLQKFVIITEMVSSQLRRKIQRTQRGSVYEYPITGYRLRYSEKLHLLSSSTYHISIRAVTNTNVYGERKIVNVQTPLSMGFEEELTMEVRDADSTILLRIPTVLNDTKTSVTNVVIKGPRDCQNYTELKPYLREKLGMKHDEAAWSAAMFPSNMFAGKTFTIGDNKVYGSARNCPLKPTESYVVAVIVLSEEGWMDGEIMVVKTTSIRIGEVPRRHDEAWIIPIAILLVAVVVVFYFYRRKRRGFLEKIIPPEEMSLAFNNENLEVKSNSSGVKEASTTAPIAADKELLSSGSTPSDNGTVCTNDANQSAERAPPVKVKDFEDYVKQAIESGLLDRQYSTLPRGQTKPWECGKLPQNKPKNRYANLIAYDENRVTLEKLPDDPHSDYINANYIKGYKKEKFYVATQGPKANTIVDFWRMIWQEESCIICMVANLSEGGKVKCEQYWPDIGKKKKYGEITVFNARHTVFADFTFRTLHVTYGDEARKIEHLHYTAWPDHGVPLFTHSVVTYLKKVLATPPGNGPVVVHCSAGVGRTGTIILCDICLRRAAAEGVVDVFSETQAIRSQRANMVDNKQQYLLAHLTLLECLLSVPTSLPCNDLLPIKIKELKKQLPIQRDSLDKMTWQDEALRPPISQTSLSERNLAKNRFPELVSAKVGRTYLKRYPPTDEDSDYISAVYVDGVRLQNQYIATQLPMPETFSDFWRMVAEYKVELIISLQPPDLNDATCCSMVPAGEFKPVPYINVRTRELTDFTHYASQRLTLVNNAEKPVCEQQVTILSSTEWKAGRNQDPPADVSLVTLWQAAEKISRGDGPIVVLCHDGVTGCGLYLALSFLLEKMTIEGECDVVLAIRAIKRSRPDFVKSLEHMEYLYDAAITYLKYFETYANFT